jgi:hypothetical protein
MQDLPIGRVHGSAAIRALDPSIYSTHGCRIGRAD